jgi:hypothetical protein
LPPLLNSPNFSVEEGKQLMKLGAIKDREGKRKLPYGREIVTKPIMREIMMLLHKGSHWGPQAMCDVILRIYRFLGTYTVAKQVCESCIICKKFNKQFPRKQPLGRRSPGLRAFQTIHVDYTEMPKTG